MKIQNDIVYAKDPEPILRVTAVKPLDGYKLHLEFNNGETKIFDFSPLINRPLYQPLKEKKIFNSVMLEFGVPVWNNGDIDIAPEYLYQNGSVA